MWGALEAGLAVGVCITLVGVLAACVCGCRKPNHKSELVGTAGVLKLHCDDEDANAADNTPLSAKRISAQNSQRSLPDIPVPVPRQDSGDTASDLYATVGLDQRPLNQSPKTVRTEHPYEHAYARLQEGFHRPEEQVAVVTQALLLSSTADSVATTSAEIQPNPESVVISASIAISGQLPSSQELPYITPPTTTAAPIVPLNAQPVDGQVVALRTDHVQHFSGDSTDSTKGYTSISVREPLSSIRAHTGNTQLQPHYASVSDDSDEMYAAIDEPNNQASYTSGSETYAQIQPTVQTVQPILHAPPASMLQNGPSDIGAGEADHSVEGPSHSRASQPPPTEKPELNHRWSLINEQPPINASHSRQESSSSGTNSIGALGSPKPEKRQANSPLPPPPAVTATEIEGRRKPHDSPLHHTKIGSRQQRISSTGDLNSNHDKLRRSLNEKHQRNNSCVSSSDFYGCNYPVDKHRFSSGDLSRPLVARELNFNIDSNTYSNVEPLKIDGAGDDVAFYENHNVCQPVKLSPIKNLEEMYAKVIKKSKVLTNAENRSRGSSRLSNYDDVDGSRSGKMRVNAQDEDMYTLLNEITTNRNANVESDSTANREDPGYETIDRMRGKSHGYETIDKISSPKKFIDPGYETVKEPRFSDRKDKFSGPDSLLSGDPGYERINREDNCPSDSDPTYEVLRPNPPTPPYASIQNFVHNAAVYSSIDKKPKKPDLARLSNNNDFLSEPNYESMPHESGYNAGSESDPNYESVGPKDPNYESVKYFGATLHDREPPYDKVQSESGSENRSSRSSSGYERIKTKHDNSNDNQVNSSKEANHIVSDYFQV